MNLIKWQNANWQLVLIANGSGSIRQAVAAVAGAALAALAALAAVRLICFLARFTRFVLCAKFN